VPKGQNQKGQVPHPRWVLLKYRSSKEVCHQEDSARGKLKSEAEEEEKGNLGWRV